MSANGHEARVAVIPDCDFCKSEGASTPAAFDGRTAQGWAFMCQPHWEQFGPGQTGLGIAQRLVLSPSPESDPDCAAHPSYHYVNGMAQFLGLDD